MKKTFKFTVSLLANFLSGCVLYYLDIFFDVLLIVQYYTEGRWLHFFITLSIIAIPGAKTILGYLKWFFPCGSHYPAFDEFCMHVTQLRVLLKWVQVIWVIELLIRLISYVLLSHLNIAYLKICLYKGDAVLTSSESSWNQIQLNYLEVECLGIRGGELYFETLPQLVFQVVTLSPASFSQQGQHPGFSFWILKNPF